MKHKYTSADLTEHQIQACVMKRATGNPAKAQLDVIGRCIELWSNPNAQMEMFS